MELLTELSLCADAGLPRADDASPRADAGLPRAAQMSPRAVDAAVVARLQEAIAGVVAQHPPALFEGAANALRELAALAPLGLISNTGSSPGRALRPVLAAAGVLECFAALSFSDEVQWAKPHRRIFEHSLAQLHARPEDALHVGDSLRADVRGAKAMGMMTLWLAPSTDATIAELQAMAPLERPDLVLPSVVAAREMLRHWASGAPLLRSEARGA